MPILTQRTWTRRVFLSGAGQAAAALATAGVLPTAKASSPAPLANAEIGGELSRFIDTYIRAMYAPGLTLGLVRADGSTAVAGFGLSDVAKGEAVRPDMLFQIGSISKSFCALVLLQMRDEGKLDVQKPILDYLPWLPVEMPYGTITVHHLLTHTSGLPDNTPIFSVDRNARLVQSYKPGSQFHYCNTAFEILGHLAASLDKKTYAACLQARILDRLGMKATRPAISNAIRPQETQSYVILRDDLAAGREAPLQPAPRAVFVNAAGCVASTPADMTLYMKMLLARGATPNGRLVSEESFALFSTPHTEAEEFGKGSHYGYGIALDTLDGHKILKHTGGMNSFASSMQVDLDGHVAAFASINAMQGYRPNPVTHYALQVMRAQSEHKPIPPAETIDDPAKITDAAEYAGTYTGDAGTVKVVAEGTTLTLAMGADRVRLRHAGGDAFVADDPKWQTAPWVFTRNKGAKPEDKGAVAELTFGRRWYVNSAYTGPHTFAIPLRIRAFEGTYDSGTDGIEVMIVKGVLTVGGTELAEIGDSLFRLADEPNSPETIEFAHVIDGRARLLISAGQPYWRVETA